MGEGQRNRIAAIIDTTTAAIEAIPAPAPPPLIFVRTEFRLWSRICLVVIERFDED